MKGVGALLLDLVYPPKCGLCGVLGDRPICDTCLAAFTTVGPVLEGLPHGVAKAVALFSYAERAAQAVRRLKFDRTTSLAAPMATMMADAAAEAGLLEVDLIVPVPIHWTRRCQRGFNQSELLCGEMPRDRVSFRALRRVRATRPQVGLSRDERIRNLSGAFVASPVVAGRRLLLVDDVLTTGHTAEECARALLAAGAARVSGLFFAAGVLG